MNYDLRDYSANSPITVSTLMPKLSTDLIVVACKVTEAARPQKVH